MDTVFRIKKGRESSRTKTSEIVSGTLDSIHQNVVSSMKQHSLNLDALKEQQTSLEAQISEIENSNELDDILKCSKLKEELKELKYRIEEEDPIKKYYLKNADIMLKYYGTTEKAQVVTTNPADQNTFLKYLNSSQVTADIPIHSKKFLYEEYTTRMKLNTGQEGYDSKEVVSEHCENCNIAREENSEEGVLVCPQCGSEAYMIVVSDFPSFRDPPKERRF